MGEADCARHPQVCVDWCDAYAYCLAVGKRLCGSVGGDHGSFDHPNSSGDQWYAACGGEPYPYGPEFVDDACHDPGPVPAGAAEVASFPGCVATYDGGLVYDLSGNVWEWQDSCGGHDGASDPCHARGGSFEGPADVLTCDAAPDPPLQRADASATLGFRCCT